MGKLNRRKLCECNTCGLYVKPGNRFIFGHQRRGKHHTEETLQKMSRSQIIAQNRPEQKEKLLHSTTKLWQDPVYRENQFLALNCPEVKEKESQAKKKNWQDPEWKENQLLVFNCPETKKKRAQTNARPEVKEKKLQSLRITNAKSETKERRSQSLKISWGDPEVKEKHILTNARPEVKEQRSRLAKIAMNKPEIKENHSKFMEECWQSPEFVRKQMIARHVKQNKIEKKLEDTINKTLPNEYKFVGHGEVVIAGKCPDFININGQKKIIELYGDYWHRDQDPQDRIDLFKQYGYDTLIIWEHELKDVDKLKIKLNEFHTKINPYSIHE